MKDLHDVPRGTPNWCWDHPTAAAADFAAKHPGLHRRTAGVAVQRVDAEPQHHALARRMGVQCCGQEAWPPARNERTMCLAYSSWFQRAIGPRWPATRSGRSSRSPALPTGMRCSVSDNSTSAGEASELQQLPVLPLPGRTVRYFRPPAPLAMPAHWRRSHPACGRGFRMQPLLHSHRSNGPACGISGDPGSDYGSVSERRGLLQSRPHRRQYPSDLVGAECFERRSRRARFSASTVPRVSGDIAGNLPSAHAELLVAPREVLLDVSNRFANFFGSTAPDCNFAFRCLETQDSILFLDSALLVHYAIDRSNGASFASGRPSRDHRDFLANLEAGTLNGAAPYPRDLDHRQYDLPRVLRRPGTERTAPSFLLSTSRDTCCTSRWRSTR